MALEWPFVIAICNLNLKSSSQMNLKKAAERQAFSLRSLPIQFPFFTSRITLHL
jgi:hypothetical protein